MSAQLDLNGAFAPETFTPENSEVNGGASSALGSFDGASSSFAGALNSSGGSSASVFAIELDFFSGPMDLLLHLVHQEEVPVEKVEMRRIAEQYLQIISNAKYLDLDRAMEYLVIAATLMSIKSRSLLPPVATPLDVEVQQPEPGSEFYEQLREQLKQYQLTKARAAALCVLPQLGVETFVRNDRKALRPLPESLGEGGNAQSLGTLFFGLLKRIGGACASMRIALEPISVVSFMMKVIDTLHETLGSGIEKGISAPGHAKAEGSFFFLAGRICRKCRRAGLSSAATPRGVVIGSFIAVLELARRGLVSAEQHDDRGEIVISERSILREHLNGDPLVSEFDDTVDDNHVENNVVHISDYRDRPRESRTLSEQGKKEYAACE